MATIDLNLILFAIILNCSFSLVASAGDEGTSIGLNDLSDECEGLEDCGDSEQLFSENLQNNYLDGFRQIQKLFKSTHSVLEKINDRLARLENYNRRYDNSLNRLDPEFYVESLIPPAKGASLNGSTTAQIAAAIPQQHALAVEIENFLDAQLTDYQLYLPDGLEHQKAPTNVFPKSTEIFTFMDDPKGFYPSGVFLYRIGNSGFSIHLFFQAAWGFAAAILENKASVRTLWPIFPKTCSSFTQTGTPRTFRCFDSNSTWNTTKTFLLHKDSVYAKLTIHYIWKTTTVKIQVFKFER